MVSVLSRFGRSRAAPGVGTGNADGTQGGVVASSKGAIGKPRPLGEILIGRGIISPMQLEIALKAQVEMPGKRLGEILVIKGFLSRERLAQVLTEQSTEIPGADHLEGDKAAGRKPSELPPLPHDVRDFAALDGHTLYVLAGRLGHMGVQSWKAEAARNGAQVRLESCDMTTLSQIQTVAAGNDSANLSAVRQVRRLIASAVAEKASDIHFTLREKEGGKGYLQVQFRTNGTVGDRLQYPQSEGEQMIRAMFQGMAAVTDAAFKETEDQHAVISSLAFLRDESGEDLGLSGIRLAKAQLMNGMNVAARLLYRMNTDRHHEMLLSDLGYSPRQLRTLHRLSRMTMGINPFTGPTGSGKSTTLANMILTILVTRHGIRIVTIEDPVEYEFLSDYVWQYRIANANTDEEKNRAFSGKLKTSLRQDPDIIMLGEIRGLETAREAVNAAITGHQVWTTLHVSDPFMIVQRLVAMGIDGFYLLDPKMLSSLIAQRLVKMLCTHCAADAAGGIPDDLDREDWDNLRTWGERTSVRFRLADSSCPHCGGSGLHGRTVVAQVIATDDALLSDMIHQGPMIARTAYMARTDAELSMEAHGILKVLAGQVDPRDYVEMLGPIPPRPKDLRAFGEDDL